jgi:two-component system CheB/CheR fusion protein
MHGGEVEVQSAGIGRGCTFTVALPLFDAPVVDKPTGLASRKLDGLRTLLVDEQHDARNTLQHLLVLAGAAVVGVDSAPAALAAAQADAFDALVVDIGSAAVDAQALLDRIRREPHLAGLPAIAISGRESELERAAAAGAGFDEFVGKPVDIEKLVDALARVVAARPAGAG